MKLLLVVLSCSILLLQNGFAQTKAKPSARLTAAFDSVLRKTYQPNEPGAAVLVVKDGTILYKKGIGMADMELGIAIQPDMIFRLGSITKQMTAVAILQLAEQGKLSLQDPITKFIPDYKIKTPITIEQLLHHTSGIRSYTDTESFWKQMRTDLTPRQIIALTEKDSLEFKPGTNWNYNNTGYVILGHIIEKVSGTSYEKYMSKHLFAPAGMQHTRYDSESTIIKNRVKGYQQNEKTFQNADYISMTLPYAAGSIISTVEDLWKWNQALYSYQLVKKEWVDKALTPYVLPDGSNTHYGYGLGINTLQGSPAIEHSGGVNGFATDAIYLPNEKVFVAVFNNCDCKEAEPVTAKLAAIALGKPFNLTPIPLTEAVAKSYEGVYTYNNEQRVLQWKDGQLTSRRGGGAVLVLKMLGKDKFFFDESITFVDVRRKADGSIEGLTITSRQDETFWTKTNKPLPKEVRVIQVDTTVLKRYPGAYQLAPGFILTVTLENGTLYAQATGQQKLELQPLSQQRFKVKNVDAELEFQMDAAGNTKEVILYQAGRSMPGKKQ